MALPIASSLISVLMALHRDATVAWFVLLLKNRRWFTTCGSSKWFFLFPSFSFFTRSLSLTFLFRSQEIIVIYVDN